MKLHDLLGTKNTKQQSRQVQQLLQAPVIDLVIRYDGRSGQVAVIPIGGNLPIGEAYKLLDAARDHLRQQELAAMQQQPPPTEHPNNNANKSVSDE